MNLLRITCRFGAGIGSFHTKRPLRPRFRAMVVAAALVVLVGTPAHARKTEEITTASGIKAWLVEEPSIPLVAIRFAFRGGALQEPAGREGLAGLLANLLTEGAGDLDAGAFARRLAETGAQLSFAATRDHVTGGLTVVTRRLEPAAELLRLALTTPRFDADAIERVRGQRLSDLELAASEPRALAHERWYRESFPAHPYGRPLNGTLESVRGVSREDVRALHRRLIARSALRVVIVGDIDKKRASELIERLFAGLPGEARLEPQGEAQPARVAMPVVVAKEMPLATAAFGLPSLKDSHPDFPALLVLNHIIGSGDFDSTLMEEIRVKRGLAYAVSTSLITDSAAAVMLGGMATKNESMGEALDVLRGVLARLAGEGPSPEQVDNAKRYLVGSSLLDLDTNARLASALLRQWIGGHGPDHLSLRNEAIARVTHGDVRRVAAEILRPERLIVTIVGRPQLGDSGKKN